jgi:hypothetical protein
MAQKGPAEGSKSIDPEAHDGLKETLLGSYGHRRASSKLKETLLGSLEAGKPGGYDPRGQLIARDLMLKGNMLGGENFCRQAREGAGLYKTSAAGRLVFITFIWKVMNKYPVNPALPC